MARQPPCGAGRPSPGSAVVSRRLPLLAAWAIVLGLGAMVWYWPPARHFLFGAPPATAIEVSGNIEAHQSVLSFTQVAAPIVALRFDEDVRVAAGTVLAQVDPRLYQRQVGIDVKSLPKVPPFSRANPTPLEVSLGFSRSRIVLLCHKFMRRVVCWQQGQRGSVRAMARAIATRTDVMEFAM